MRKQIRRGCFETNSSSMHSIVVKREDVVDKHSPAINSGIYVYNGKLHIFESDLHFGREPFEVLDTFYKKLRYAIAEKCGTWRKASDGDAIFQREFLPIITEFLPDIQEITFDDLEDYVVANKEGKSRAKCVVVGKDYGCIDHQSAGLLTRFLEKNNISLKDFLTNPRYVVIIDGDEYGIWETLKGSGLVDLGAIEDEYPKGSIPYDSFVYKEGNGAEVGV